MSEPPPTPPPRYLPREGIASGGTAEVVAAWDVQLHREVALKLLRSEKPGARARFLAETQVAAQLEHPNIIPVHDSGTTAEGQVFLAMKLVRGHSLTTWLRDSPPLPARLDLFRKVCDAIAFAHSRGVLHRDLKPDNVMVGAFGEVFVADWGLARPIRGVGAEAALDVDGFAGGPQRTREGQIAGTPAYMAPEQAAGRLAELDERTDVYGLGALLWELLVGRPPLSGPVDQVLAAVATGLPAPRSADRSVPRELDAVVRRATSVRPEARYPSAKALRSDIDAFLEGRPLPGIPSSPAAHLLKWALRHRRPLLGASVVAGPALLAGLVLSVGYALQLRAANAEVAAGAKRAAAAEVDATRALVSARLALSDSLAAQGRPSEAAGALVPVREAARRWPDLAQVVALAEAQRAAEAPGPIAVCPFPGGPSLAMAVAVDDTGERLAAWTREGARVEWSLPDCAVQSTVQGAKAGRAALGFVDGELVGVMSGAGALHRVRGAMESEAWPLAGVRNVGLRGAEAWAVTESAVWWAEGDAWMVDPWVPPGGGTWSPDGPVRVATDSVGGKARTRVFSEAGRELSSVGDISTHAVTPDGTAILLGAAEGLQLVDFATGERRWGDPGEAVQRVYAAPGDAVGLEVGYGGRVRVRDLTTGAVQLTVAPPDGQVVGAVGVATNARFIALGLPGGVAVYLRPPSPRRDADPGNDVTQGLALSPDGSLLAVGDDAGRIRLVDTATRKELWRLSPECDGVRQIAFSPDGRTLAAALRGRGLGTFDVLTGRAELNTAIPGRAISVAWSEGALLTVDTEGWLWRAPLDGRPAERVRQVLASSAWELAPLDDGNYLVATHISGSPGIRVIRADGETVESIKTTAAVYHVASHGSLLALAEHDGQVLLWDRSRREGRRIAADDGPVLGVDFSPDGALLATTGFGGAVRLWSVVSGAEVRSLPERTSPGTDVQFLPTGLGLVSTGLDGFAFFDLSPPSLRTEALTQLTGPEPEASRAAAALGWWARVSPDAEPVLRARAALAEGRPGAAKALLSALGTERR